MSFKVYCPNKACNMLLDGDDYDFESDRVKQILVNTTCPYCTKPFCALCLKEAHEEGEVKNDQAFKDLATQKKWKPCPGCGHMVEKSEGKD
ncbi:hypothetical protein BGX34_003602 [Mortierella sp. NVP85]|nr:hypothetical protein BGX34_003602 [Mortierella sp. NVP85]